MVSEPDNNEKKRSADDCEVTVAPKKVKKRELSQSPSDDRVRDSATEETYRVLSQVEHVLHRPDPYVGSVVKELTLVWVLDGNKMRHVELDVVPGLIKIFDEVFMNAMDEARRQVSCKSIRVSIDQQSGTISIYNSGKGIPIRTQEVELNGVAVERYIPDIVFGILNSGSNFDDSVLRSVSGRNGLGAKLTNVFSTEFAVNVQDPTQGLEFDMMWAENMNTRGTPKIRKMTKKSGSVRITFKPDLARFGLSGTSDAAWIDACRIMKTRVYEGAMCCPKHTKVHLADKELSVQAFKDFVELFTEDAASPSSQPIIVEQTTADNEGTQHTWKLAIVPCNNPGGKLCVSYVNGINTYHGGTHVNLVTSQVVNCILEGCSKKSPASKNVKHRHITDNMMIVLSCSVPNPSFDNQSKTKLTTSRQDLKPYFVLESVPGWRKVKTQIMESAVVELARLQADAGERKAIRSQEGNCTRRTVKAIPKLDDANLAGTKRSGECTLILTEGDSAKGAIVSAISVVGRDRYGIFPLRGKLLNATKASVGDIAKNNELQNLKQILGLKTGEKYESTRSLRYGKIMIATDQDHDGTHIKALMVLFIHNQWPELLPMGFVQSLRTPLIKATKPRAEALNFYNDVEYKEWCTATDEKERAGYRIKYYKGLGTLTPTDARDIFRSLEQHTHTFVRPRAELYLPGMDAPQRTWGPDQSIPGETLPAIADVVSQHGARIVVPEESKLPTPELQIWADLGGAGAIDYADSTKGALKLAFGGDGQSDERKQWQLRSLCAPTPPALAAAIGNDDKLQRSVPQLIHEDFVEFSKACNSRSLPHLMDGLKPSQRKSLFYCLQHPTKEWKVAELSGLVSAETAYHHGDASLQGCIVKMAQDFFGSNQVNLLRPIGQFGTRMEGGDDAAAARYIYTGLSPCSRLLFPSEDSEVLPRVVDEGKQVEPRYYTPTLPTVLINGAGGIGSGWSTKIPTFRLSAIVENVKKLCQSRETKLDEMPVHFEGFRGSTHRVSSTEYQLTGTYRLFQERGNDYIQVTELPPGVWTNRFKQNVMKKPWVKDIIDNTTDKVVDYTIRTEGPLPEGFDVVKELKLTEMYKISNMHMYDTEGKIRRFSSAEEILLEWFDQKLVSLEARRLHMLACLEHQLRIAENRARFIAETRNEEINCAKCSTTELDRILRERGYFENDGSYSYLRSLSVDQMTTDKIEQLRGDIERKTKRSEYLRETTCAALLLEDVIKVESSLSQESGA